MNGMEATWTLSSDGEREINGDKESLGFFYSSTVAKIHVKNKPDIIFVQSFNK